MKITTLALTLSLVLGSNVMAAPVFDGTTIDRKVDSELSADKDNNVEVKHEKTASGTPNIVISDKNEKVEMLDIQEYFDLKVKKDKNGKIQDFSLNQDKVNEIFKISAPLKVGTMMAFERNGKLAFVSENQRFYFIGELYDMFNGMKKINSPDDIKKFANRIDYKKMGIDINTLNSTSVGSGDKQVVIWVSPDSPYTKQIMDDAISIAKKDMQKYTFYFVVIPSGTEESFALTKKFYCGRQDGNLEIGNMLYQGTLNNLTDSQCNLTGFEKTLAIKYMSDIDLVPFVVAHDGRVSRGIPSQGLEIFLNEADGENGSIDNNDPKQIEIRKELQEKITEAAAEDDLHNEQNNVDYNSLKTQNPEVLTQEEILKRIEDIKTSYRPRIEKVQNRINGENMSYKREKDRVVNAQNSLNNDNRMDANKKLQKLADYQNRINAIDDKYGKVLERLESEKENLLNQQQSEIDSISGNYVNKE